MQTYFWFFLGFLKKTGFQPHKPAIVERYPESKTKTALESEISAKKVCDISFMANIIRFY
jgi:hypothetical protein